MRQFLVIGHDAPLDADFPLEDLPGAAGRFDVLCRCVTSGLLVSHGVREDVRVHLVLRDEVTITVDGATVRRLNPDERSTAALLRGALEEIDEAIGHQPVESSPGITLRRRGLEETLSALAEDSTIYQLHEDGQAVDTLEPPADPTFVLSDHHDFSADEQALLEEVATDRIRLGPTALHADQAITVSNHFLDTEGYSRF